MALGFLSGPGLPHLRLNGKWAMSCPMGFGIQSAERV